MKKKSRAGDMNVTWHIPKKPPKWAMQYQWLRSPLYKYGITFYDKSNRMKTLTSTEKIQLRERCLEMAGRYTSNHFDLVGVTKKRKEPNIIVVAERFYQYILNGRKK